jgi:hypothetical protein
MRRVIVETTLREDYEDHPWRTALAITLRLCWPAFLVLTLVGSIRHVDDGDPTWRFASWRDVAAFAGIVAALTLELRAAVVWLLRRRTRQP